MWLIAIAFAFSLAACSNRGTNPVDPDSVTLRRVDTGVIVEGMFAGILEDTPTLYLSDRDAVLSANRMTSDRPSHDAIAASGYDVTVTDGRLLSHGVQPGDWFYFRAEAPVVKHLGVVAEVLSEVTVRLTHEVPEVASRGGTYCASEHLFEIQGHICAPFCDDWPEGLGSTGLEFFMDVDTTVYRSVDIDAGSKVWRLKVDESGDVVIAL